MRTELLKMIVQPVLLERNDDGVVIGERLLDGVAVYSTVQWQELVSQIQSQLENANASSEARWNGTGEPQRVEPVERTE